MIMIFRLDFKIVIDANHAEETLAFGIDNFLPSLSELEEPSIPKHSPQSKVTYTSHSTIEQL